MAKTTRTQDVTDMLLKLPAEKQQEVRDFVEFLLHKSQQDDPQEQGAARGAARRNFIQRFVQTPIKGPHFKPLSRDEAHLR
jgi:hypothetical protein